MSHQIQRLTAPCTDGYRGSGPKWQRADRQNTARESTVSSQPLTGKAATFDAQIRQKGDLQITTDDGDKVSISFAALSRVHAESFQGQAGSVGIDYSSASSLNKMSIGIQVDGSLNDKELGDIGKLLEQLAASVHDSGPSVSGTQLQDGGSLASLSSFQFAYQEQIRASYSQSQISGQADFGN